MLLGKDFVETQLESVSKRNPMSLLANMANGSSTQGEDAPRTVNPNNKNGTNLMPSNMKSNEIRKADPSAAAGVSLTIA